MPEPLFHQKVLLFFFQEVFHSLCQDISLLHIKHSSADAYIHGIFLSVYQLCCFHLLRYLVYAADIPSVSACFLFLFFPVFHILPYYQKISKVLPVFLHLSDSLYRLTPLYNLQDLHYSFQAIF